MKNIKTKYDIVRNISNYKRLKKFFNFFDVKSLFDQFFILVVTIFILGVVNFSFAFFYTLIYVLYTAICAINTKIEDKENEHLKKMKKLCKKATGKKIKIDSVDEIEIIPKNIKVGEDLSNRNIISIFKDGYYVIVKSNNERVIFQEIYQNEKKAKKIYELMHPNYKAAKNFLINYLTEEDYSKTLENDREIIIEENKIYRLKK